MQYVFITLTVAPDITAGTTLTIIFSLFNFNFLLADNFRLLIHLSQTLVTFKKLF